MLKQKLMPYILLMSTTMMYYYSKAVMWLMWSLMQMSLNLIKTHPVFGNKKIKIIKAITEDTDVTEHLKTFLRVYWDDDAVDEGGFNVFNFLKMIDKGLLYISYIKEENVDGIREKIKTKMKDMLIDYNEDRIYTSPDLIAEGMLIGDEIEF